MRSEDTYAPNLGEIARVVNSAEVVVLRFPLLADRLLIDFRCHDDTGPFVQVVPLVSGFEERVRELRAVRPQFPAPERIMVIGWPRTIAGLRETGVLPMIAARLARTGFSLEPQLRQAWQSLIAMEQEAQVAAVLGVGYQSLWERHTAGRNES